MNANKKQEMFIWFGRAGIARRIQQKYYVEWRAVPALQKLSLRTTLINLQLFFICVHLRVFAEK